MGLGGTWHITLEPLPSPLTIVYWTKKRFKEIGITWRIWQAKDISNMIQISWLYDAISIAYMIKFRIMLTLSETQHTLGGVLACSRSVFGAWRSVCFGCKVATLQSVKWTNFHHIIFRQIIDLMPLPHVPVRQQFQDGKQLQIFQLKFTLAEEIDR